MTERAPAPPFTPEHEAFRAEVREFVARELRPRAPDWERARWFPDEVFGWFAERGWLDLDPIRSAVLSEELGRCGSGGLAAGIGAHVGIATPPIRRFGTEFQRARWVEPALRGEKIGALAITEPGGGSDVAAVRTRAQRVDGGWLVNGEKTYITNGVRADFYVTAVRTAPEGGHHGMSFLVIERGAGVRASRLDKLGWHASDTATVVFDDVFVPADHLLGELDRGFYLIMANFQGERLGMALVALGEMRDTLERTLAWAAEQPPSQARRFALAELAVLVEAGAAVAYDALRRMLAGDDAVREVTMAKLWTQRANLRVQEECVRLRGVEGALVATGLERALRDARLGPIGGGTDEIMREILGRSFGL
ncbi:MAG TPA: acyl-CoA dehydrogenase family protein [Solirubrobacteraceae bacterium]|nr:acyl-CoA dehydrogenase family protein [Solirubrobacteraceae bacterium]